MKLSAALTTLVTLTSLTSALPNKALNFNKRQSFNQTANATTPSGSGVASTSNLNMTVPVNTTNPNGNGVDPNANNLPSSTQTIVQTLTTTITQQYTTFTQTSTFTATVVIPGGANGVSSIPSNIPGSAPAVVAGNTGSGNTGSGSTGSGSTGAGSGVGAAAGSQCVCSAPAVVATGIYTVALQTLVDLGSTTQTIVNPTTTLGLMTISGGQVVGATPTITHLATPVANTNAALAPGQAYQTIAVPGSGSTPSINIVVIVSIVTPVVSPVAGTNPYGNGVDANANTLPTTSAGPYSNSTSTTTSSSATGSQAAVGSPQAQTSGALVSTASAPTATPQATVAPNTQQAQIGSEGTTPLVNQDGFVQAMVDAHNMYRARHGVQPVTYSSQLAAVALANVNANAAAGTFDHTNTMKPGSDPYGENLGEQYGANNPATLVYLWYNEIQKYDYNNATYSEATGHFTQLVWDDSVTIGCAYIQESTGNMYYLLACEYQTPGNIVGSTPAETQASFNQHVKPVIAGAAPYSAPPANV